MNWEWTKERQDKLKENFQHGTTFLMSHRELSDDLEDAIEELERLQKELREFER